jgi:hypothetical protein
MSKAAVIKRLSQGGHLIMTTKISVATIRRMRQALLRIKGMEAVAARAAAIQLEAAAMLERVASRMNRYDVLSQQCATFNKFVAELLIIRDYDIVNSMVPIRIAYMQLQLAAHHIILDSAYAAHAAAFARLAKKTADGMWTSAKTMPAIALFQELHGLSPRTLQLAHKMTDPSLDVIANFTPALNKFVANGTRTGKLTELFELCRDFYRQSMHIEFWAGKQLTGPSGKAMSLEEWFETMIKLAKEVDLELP